MALAYCQVNDFLCRGSFQAIKAHRKLGYKKDQQACSASNPPIKGMANLGGLCSNREIIKPKLPLNTFSNGRKVLTPLT